MTSEGAPRVDEPIIVVASFYCSWPRVGTRVMCQSNLDSRKSA